MSSEIAGARARMLMNRLEVDNAKLEAKRASLAAKLHRLRNVELEAEKCILEAKALELDRHANEDQLTRLWNRRYIETVLPARFEDARCSGAPISVAMADLDHFKEINDRFGQFTVARR